jgi:hypothetical protein
MARFPEAVRNPKIPHGQRVFRIDEVVWRSFLLLKSQVMLTN